MNQVNNSKTAVAQLLSKVGNNIVIATPLGIGKPNHFLNCLYQTVKSNPDLQLTILTALSLVVPEGKSSLEQSFLKPMTDRVFADYPGLDYESDRMRNQLPKNIKVIEFYFQAGKYKKVDNAQNNYLSSNYTHVVRDLVARGVNAICQQVVSGENNGDTVFSLSCNSDLTIDLAELCEKQRQPLFKVAQANPDLPFMYGESIVKPEFFNVIVDNPKEYFSIFAPPKLSVPLVDYIIGLHASTLIKDNGEIQIGIGSLCDALIYSLCLRQNQNDIFQKTIVDLEIDNESFPVLKDSGEVQPFEKGLFACTEMLVDSFAELYKEKILKKKVFDSVTLQRLLNEGLVEECFSHDILDHLIRARAIHTHLSQSDFYFLQEYGILKASCQWQKGRLVLPDGTGIDPDLNNPEVLMQIKQQGLGSQLRNGAVAHAGFFIGPRSFYDFLKNLPIPERKLFRMKRISQINHLYGHEEIDRLQRTNARFVNTCMKVTLNGSANSDALDNGLQISGVGGQYNFVAMAHELPEAHSILQLRSTHTNKNGKIESNIVFNYPNCTIPRHLRDIVITEYGIASLRGKTNSEVAAELIKIADSRFQPRLIEQAIKAKKLPKGFKLSQRFKNNKPSRYQDIIRPLQKENLFPSFPFGTDLNNAEITLGDALKKINTLRRKPLHLIVFFCRSLWQHPIKADEKKLLQRIELDTLSHWKDWFIRKMIVKSLRQL